MKGNCSGSHQGTKPALPVPRPGRDREARRLHIVLRSTKARSGPGTQRIDMSFNPLSEKEEGIARKTVHQKRYQKNNSVILVPLCLSGRIVTMR